MSNFAGQSGNAVKNKDKRNSKILNKYFCFVNLMEMAYYYYFFLYNNQKLHTAH